MSVSEVGFEIDNRATRREGDAVKSVANLKLQDNPCTWVTVFVASHMFSPCYPIDRLS